MALDSLISLKILKNNSLLAFFYSAIIAIISVYVSYVIFREYAGIFIAFLISVAITPIFKKLMIINLKKDVYRFRRSFIDRHYETLKSFLVVFFGITFGLTLIFYFLPPEISSQIFKQQTEIIQRIRGNFVFGEGFLRIFLNNLSVLTLSFILSFLYGGFMFVLAWNITVLAAAIGMLRESYGMLFLPLGLITYLPHGIFEFIAYFLGTLSGLILSSYFMKGKYKSSYILKDAIKMYLFGVFLLLIGALIEIFIIYL